MHMVVIMFVTSFPALSILSLPHIDFDLIGNACVTVTHFKNPGFLAIKMQKIHGYNIF